MICVKCIRVAALAACSWSSKCSSGAGVYKNDNKVREAILDYQTKRRERSEAIQRFYGEKFSGQDYP